MSFCVAKTNECLRACEQVLASVSELAGDSLLHRRVYPGSGKMGNAETPGRAFLTCFKS